jgi:hypothetical protein
MHIWAGFTRSPMRAHHHTQTNGRTTLHTPPPSKKYSYAMQEVLTAYLGLSPLESNLVCSPMTQKHPRRQLSYLHNKKYKWSGYVVPMPLYTPFFLTSSCLFEIVQAMFLIPFAPTRSRFPQIYNDTLGLSFDFRAPGTPFWHPEHRCTSSVHILLSQNCYIYVLFSRYVSRREFGLNV